MTIICGIDPGLNGAISIVAQENSAAARVVDAFDVPLLGSGAKLRVDVIAVQEWLLRHGPTAAFIERAGVMPRQGVASGFKYGRATGALGAVITVCAIPLEIIEPSIWKRFFKLPGKDKEAARQRAISLFPAAHHLFARRKDHQRAESALLALYGLRTLQPAIKAPDAAVVEGVS